MNRPFVCLRNWRQNERKKNANVILRFHIPNQMECIDRAPKISVVYMLDESLKMCSILRVIASSTSFHQWMASAPYPKWFAVIWFESFCNLFWFLHIDSYIWWFVFEFSCLSTRFLFNLSFVWRSEKFFFRVYVDSSFFSRT